MGTPGYSYGFPFAPGALLTELLSNAGKSLLGVTLERTGVPSDDGTAGSLVGVSSRRRHPPRSFSFGVRSARIHSDRYGSPVQLVRGAETVTLREVISEQARPVA